MKHVLITGGAGFIGSHVADELLRAGYTVRALDNLTPQVHPDGQRPDYLDPRVELMVGDIRDPEAVEGALSGIDAVVHLAAALGVGQSMYELTRFTDVNDRGTAVLLEALIRRPVERLVVASSMCIYGEGLYESADGRAVEGTDRAMDRLEAGDFEVRDPDGRPLTPIPTPETKTPSLSSVYALTKLDQEQLCLMIGRAYGIPALALRLFNVYGPRQALSNPYTGVLAIFAARLLNDRPPVVYEDGLQSRDFVNVRDVARAFRLALESDAKDRIINIGGGEAKTVRQVAESLAQRLGKQIAPQMTGQARRGDVRHCHADIRLAGELLGYAPRVRFVDGVQELAEWLSRQTAVDRADQANSELLARGLTAEARTPSRR